MSGSVTECGPHTLATINDLREQLAQALKLNDAAYAALRLAREAILGLDGWVPYSQGFAETDKPKVTKALEAIQRVLG